MTRKKPGKLGNVLTVLTDLACKAPRRIAIAALIITVAAAAFMVTNLTIDTNTAGMLSSELKFRRLDRELNEAFPKGPDQLLVVVEGKSPDLVADAAELLSGVLRNRPDLFQSVFDPEGDPFFQRNGLLFPNIDDLSTLIDRLSAAQPFLGALARDRSLRGLFDMLSLAAEHNGDAEGVEGMNVADVMNRISAVAEAEEQDRFARLSWMRLMTGQADDGLARRFIIVQPVLDYSELRPAQEPIETVRSIARDLGYDGGRGVTVRLTGAIALNDDELQTVTIGMGAAGALSLVLVVALLLVALRSPRTTAAALITLIAGLIWTGAFAVVAVGALNLISVAFAVLFIGLSVDFSIHYALRFREEWEHGHSVCRNLHATVEGIGSALALAAVTAAIGFLSFTPTAYRGLAELGIIAAGGMIIALFLNLTLLPALIVLLHPKLARPVTWETEWQSRVAAFVGRHAKTVALVSLGLGIGAAALLPQAYFDFDPLNLKDPDSESVRTLLDLMADDPTQGYAAVYLAKSVEEADALAARLKQLPVVASTRTVSDFVPSNQDEKLQLIDSLALVLEPALTAPRLPPPTHAETAAALKDLEGKLATLEHSDDAKLAAASHRLLQALTNLEKRAVVDPYTWPRLETRLLSGLYPRLEALQHSLLAKRFSRSDLPHQLIERWLVPDGRARLEIYPSEPVHRDSRALAEFITQVRTIVPDAIGAPVEIYEGGRAVIRAFLQAAAIAVVAIAALLLILLRNVRDTLVIFSPLVLAALLTVAASVLFKIPFNFANVIVLPLLFGLGVAGSLHIVIRERKEGANSDVLSTSTPRAVMFSTLTTIASFGSLSLSKHPGTASMGVLLTIALILTLLCTLLTLPAVMALFGSHRNTVRPPKTG